MNINLIVAVSDNNVIAIDGKLPWHLSDDLKRFKTLTTNNSIILGRKTFESIGKPLPNRENIVISRNAKFPECGVIVVDSLTKAFAKSTKDVFIIGGAEIYKLALPYVNTIYLTKVNLNITGDNLTYLDLDLSEFKIVDSEKLVENNINFEYVKLERIS